MWQYNYSSELYHYGVMGMKWGVRRYQNKDGSLTKAGKKRYFKEVKKITKAKQNDDYSTVVDEVSKITKNALSKETINAKNEFDRIVKENFKRLGNKAPDETTVWRKAQKQAADNYVKKELNRNPDYYTTERDRYKLSEYAWAELGYDAGKKAFNQKYPDYKKYQMAEDKAWNDYHNSLKNDVNRLISEKIGKKKINNKKYYWIDYQKLISDAVLRA